MTTLRTSAADAGHSRTRRRIPYRWLTVAVAAATLAAGSVAVALPAAAAASTWTVVSAGTAHTCGIKTDTTLWCWGANNAGQLGTGDNLDRSAPAAVRASAGWTFISVGYDFTCGIQAGYRYCWGINESGQLGLSDYADRNVPTRLADDGNHWLKIDAGQRHACGINNNNTSVGLAVAQCWGSNLFGQLGTGDYGTQNVPTTIAITGHRFYWISAGGQHTCAIDTTFYRYCWGRNDAHQLGMVEASTDPQLVPFHDSHDGKYQATGVDSGDGTSCVIPYSTRWLECYGRNTYGNIGNGNTTPTDDTVNFGTWKSTSSGGYHACGIDDNGTLYCWGHNNAGQLGLGDGADRLVVTQLFNTGPYLKVSAGFMHTCAIRTDSTLYCWGYNAQGQLGLGNRTNVNTPQPVA